MLGRTVHSRFRASLNPTEGYSFNIKLQTTLAKLIQECTLIVWDEAPMMHRYHLEAMDISLRDIMKEVDPKYKHMAFGGKVRAANTPRSSPTRDATNLFARRRDRSLCKAATSARRSRS